MDKLKREELPRTDKPSVILVNEIKSEYGEEVSEDEVDGEVSIRIAYEIQPVRRSCTVSRRFEDATT